MPNFHYYTNDILILLDFTGAFMYAICHHVHFVQLKYMSHYTVTQTLANKIVIKLFTGTSKIQDQFHCCYWDFYMGYKTDMALSMLQYQYSVSYACIMQIVYVCDYILENRQFMYISYFEKY